MTHCAINMDKYQTSTFLTGLFCKFRLRDKRIRKAITDLYGDLINVILTETSYEKRIILFKLLIPTIKSTIDYFEKHKEARSQVDKELLQVLANFVGACTHVIQKVGIRDDAFSKVFDDIMKQAFIDDIACDIGECIGLHKKTAREIEKSEIIDRLTVLLTDYNDVMDTNLSVDEILHGKEDR